MSCALTFLFKEIFPTKEDFLNYLTEYNIVENLTSADDENFANYIYKILYRRYANSNVQFDTIEDFKLNFANVLEDNFKKYKQQLRIIQKVQNLTDDELITISTALANQSNNPNTAPDDPTKPLEFISAQAFTLARDNKLQAYLRAVNTIPTQLIDEMLMRCANLFKTLIPNQVFVYENEEE